MKARLFTAFAVFVLAVGLVFVLTWAVAAQGPEPSAQPERGGPPPQPPPAWEGGKPFPHPPQPLRGGLSAQGVSAAVTLGQPGTVYRYVQTFGETEVAYTSTTTHLNRPYALAVDGADNVYVGEKEGHRVLKFNASGTFQAQIGYTGLCRVSDEPGTGTCAATGLAVAPDGNVWIAEEWPNRVSVFTYTTTAFTYIEHLGITWESGSDNDRFNSPEGVAFDSAGRIYVADRENNRVQVFSSTRAYSATIGGTCGIGDYELCRPHGLAMGSGDVLYVADSDNARVQVFQLVGDSMVFSQSITTTDTTVFNWVSAVAVDANNLYVADEGSGQVHVFSRNGVYGATIAGDCGGSKDWFCSPMDVAVDSSGNVYVADPWERFRVMKCGGWTCTTFAGFPNVPYTTTNYLYNKPNGIAVDGSGNIFLTEEMGRQLIKLNSSGTFQWSVGTPGIWGNDDAHFGNPQQVAFDSSGRLYVADADNNRVQIFNSNGSYFNRLGGGNCGVGNNQFCWPAGVAVGSNGRIYVADTNNHRVQVFNSSRTRIATLGTTGVSGNDNSHFNYPRGVTVDSSNNVYVADSDNRRVQKCTVVGTGGTCTLFAGVTGEGGDDFDHFGYPTDVAAVGGKVFVADAGNNRIQVFDSSGAYLTTIGGNWGGNNGQLRNPMGVDVDGAGNVYVAENENQRIQKFARGVPGWAQRNINGFGDAYNRGWSEAHVYSNSLYIAAANEISGCEVWRTSDGTSWTQANDSGFGDSDNGTCYGRVDFNDYFYVGTLHEDTGGEVWRCAASSGCDGPSDWGQVGGGGLGDPNNLDVEPDAVFGSYLYVDTTNPTSGCQVLRSSDGTSWAQVNSDGFGDANNTAGTEMAVFNSYLYLGTVNGSTGGEVWRCQTCDGSDWSQVGSDGLGDADNWGIWPLAEFNGGLYVDAWNRVDGARVYSSTDGTAWTQVNTDGFGDANNYMAIRAAVYSNTLYVGAGNSTSGLGIWKTSDGTTWEQVPPDGFGDSNNDVASLAVFNDNLYVATENWANGGEVWVYLDKKVYLPIILKNSR
jgi:DNA-binding beta-propeller fold protein YncE